MSLDTDFWQEMKKPPGKAPVKNRQRAGRSGRDVIFRTLLPGVFVVMAVYRLLVVSPETADFYTRLMAKAITAGYKVCDKFSASDLSGVLSGIQKG